ncbi:MAG TPA: zinc-dependent metalloprotease family protein, partial [Thermoanaerobaculia bacterium]
GDEWLFIDPLREYVPGAPARLAVVYREADVRPEAGGQCGLEHLRKAGRALGLGYSGAKDHTTLRRLDIATDGDGEYYQRYGVGGFDRIAAIINGVDGIYRNQINLFLRITFQQLWTDPATDPYTSPNDIIATINQFTDWWNANRANVNRDVAHLFSGKSFSTFIGYAWIAVVCNNPGRSYSVSQDLEPQFIRVELMAHELGHNLSATHDDQSPVCPGVNCNGFGPIMCSVIQGNGTNTFSSCSKSQIDNHTHNNSFCLN